MKKLIAIIALIAIGYSAEAQVRGSFGTYTPFTSTTGTINKVVAGTITPVTSGRLDTLTNADTGYIRMTLNSNYAMVFDLSMTKITGTLAGTAVLQGSTDNTNWVTLTGITTTCSGCQGASATITDGSAHYKWAVPVGAVPFQYYQMRAITTGTCTASYTGTVGYKY